MDKNLLQRRRGLLAGGPTVDTVDTCRYPDQREGRKGIERAYGGIGALDVAKCEPILVLYCVDSSGLFATLFRHISMI